MNRNPYVLHKLNMESLIQNFKGTYHIFRISNLAGRTKNPHTVLNFFFQHIASGNPFQVWQKSFRNIVDIEDAARTCHHIYSNGLFKNEITNIANLQNYPVHQIVKTIEMFLGKKGNFTFFEKESNPSIDTTAIENIYLYLGINFGKEYLENILTKYYSY